MKIYKLECLNEDGMIEVNGYYFDIQNAQKDAKELNESPRSKKYGIIHNVEEIETSDSLSPSTPLKQLSDEEIFNKAEEYTRGYPQYWEPKSIADVGQGYMDGFKDAQAISVSPLKEDKTDDYYDKADEKHFPKSDHINPIELLEWATENYLPFINSNFKEWINRNEEDGFVLTTSQLIETFNNRKEHEKI